MNITFNVTM